MNKLNIILCFLLLPLLLLETNGQKKSDERTEFFRLPDDMTIVLLANRGMMPIRIESVKLFTNDGGNRIKCAYQFRNTGDQGVRAIEVTNITNFLFRPTGGGRMETYTEIVSFEGDNSKRLKPLFPGELRNYGELFDEDSILADEIVRQIRQQPSRVKAKFIVVLAISRVEYANGSILDMRSDAVDIEMLLTYGIGVR